MKKKVYTYIGTTRVDLPERITLYDLYIKKKINMPQIARQYETNSETIRCRLKRFNIKIRTTSESQKGKHNSPKTQFKEGHSVSKKVREKMRNAKLGKPSLRKGQKHTKESIEKNRQAHLGKKASKKTLLKMSNTHKEKWKDEEYVKRIFKARGMRPNKPEQLMIELIKQNNLPFNYVGDGEIIIGGFNPDFLSKNPKQIIEVYGNYWHNLPKVKARDIRRLRAYKKYGYKTLIIWEDELKNLPQVANKIKEFIK